MGRLHRQQVLIDLRREGWHRAEQELREARLLVRQRVGLLEPPGGPLRAYGEDGWQHVRAISGTRLILARLSFFRVDFSSRVCSEWTRSTFQSFRIWRFLSPV